MTKQIEKPLVLSDEEIKHKVQAILDFGVNVDDEVLKLIQQAKVEVAREMEHFMQMHLHARPDAPTATMKFGDWMKLRKLLSKYMEEK